ncbi:3-oxoacyl-ACP reductase [Haematobacter missouriensis]|uniref:NAD(P)-dependent oxidoreductase n=1 Tax=Haematobacter missouriensis TaxID=366616 RepID=A0A212ASQ2_9RHOB|nr:SDR family oxidoreductase [Haematobacter missouriensis]KFI31563.1 3-oxoacyl-ACP reductase [Haematobacter missouriensis]OWJ75421.1 NAD(P)-dependent oxidoreductase [Haematobacter missouriensis]OWJ84537.1 NAD(P)-dependent oxidoreductase [Haematobacter missouriensis]
MARFDGKTVIVTGASSGIGLATARRFSEEGANVVLVARDEEALAGAAKDLDQARTLTFSGDISREPDVISIADAAVARFGRIDVLCNNAGIGMNGRIDEMSLEDWRKVIDIDLTGVFLMSRAVWPQLEKVRGAVVNTSSVSGLGGDWGMFAYNAAKGGVSNMTRALALDARDSGIRVNGVAPALTRTGMTEEMMGDEALVQKFLERIPLGRVGEPEDVAAVIAFLASDDARFVNGVIIPVDGGMHASNGQPPQA